MLRALRAWLLKGVESPAPPQVPSKKCEIHTCGSGCELGVRLCPEHHELVKLDHAELSNGHCPLCARKLARSTKVKLVAKTKKSITYSCPFHGVSGFVYDVSSTI